MDRFKFRIPVYDNENKFVSFTKLDIEKGIAPYNYGKVHHEEKEQCTGLKDKNGKLIYEGDYIKSGNVIHRICWDNKNAKFVAQNKGYSCEIYQSWIDECKFEVVGNIHQNSELLNDNK